MTRNLILWSAFAFLLNPLRIEAAAPKLAGVSVVAANPSRVDLMLDGGVEQDGLDKPEFWLVLLATKTDLLQATVSAVTITGCSMDTVPRLGGPCPNKDKVVMLALTITPAAPAMLAWVEVVYSGPLGPASQTFKMAEPGKSILSGAKKDDADISFSGSYGWTAGSGKKYNIDTFAGYMHQLGDAQYAGFYGQAKTKDAADIDPQSFLVYGVWRYVLGSGEFNGPFQGAIVNGLGGSEFDKKGQARNAVVSPTIIVPFRLTTGTLGLIEPGFTTPNGTLNVGVEVVKPVTSAQDDRSWRYRALIGSTFTAGLQRKKSGFYGIAFKAAYVVRFLSADEPFMDPRHATVDPTTGKKKDPPLEFGDQPRHHAEASINYLFAEWAGVDLKYEYGGLPPAFVLTDHTLTFEVTLTLKQTSSARSAIMKP
jgi:hypothetical protein